MSALSIGRCLAPAARGGRSEDSGRDIDSNIQAACPAARCRPGSGGDRPGWIPELREIARPDTGPINAVSQQHRREALTVYAPMVACPDNSIQYPTFPASAPAPVDRVITTGSARTLPPGQMSRRTMRPIPNRRQARERTYEMDTQTPDAIGGRMRPSGRASGMCKPPYCDVSRAEFSAKLRTVRCDPG